MKSVYAIFIVVVVLGINACKAPDPYEPPDWLAGKLYTQISEQDDLSEFSKCLQRTGYDTILNISGSYTVFAPTNDAFTLYFTDHPEYQSVGDIPLDELRKIVKYHIVQNAWSKEQLRSLDVWGWIDTLDVNNDEPKGYKRETLLLDKNRKFGVRHEKHERIVLLDTLSAGWFRRVATDSRKYAPIFYKDYFDIYDLDLSDYEFYFGRPFSNPADIFYVSGRIEGDELFAENGFVYNIDRVVEPLQNAYQLVSSQLGGQTYTSFRNLMNYFPVFTYNDQATKDQPGAEQGLVVDSLFDLRFPELAFDVTNEKTQPPSGTFGLPSNVTIRYHHGVVAPTDQALGEFINAYLTGPNRWGSVSAAPIHIKRIIANTHLSVNPVYKTDLENGFYNGELDYVTVDPEDVVVTQYGSNCTFVGISKAIVPRAFKSVTGPIYLRRGYSYVMYAIERAGLLPALKRENQDYMFFVESDANNRADSSLVYEESTEDFITWQITAMTKRRNSLSASDLRTLLMNHVGTRLPLGLARKEFIKNLAGNYLIVNNETGMVTGTAPTTQGYNGLLPSPGIPTQISTGADNGITYDIDDWFSFNVKSLYQQIQDYFPGFQALLQKAGLTQDKLGTYSFISETELYTVLAPSDSVLAGFNSDSLSTQELRDLCMLHFIQGSLIFTDGSQTSGYYETTRKDESSTEFTTVFSGFYVETGIDKIRIPDKDGGTYVSIEESGSTNILAGRNVDESTTPVFPNLVNTAVIHQIDRVLSYEMLDKQN